MDLSPFKNSFLFKGIDGRGLAILGALFVEKTIAEGRTVFVEERPGEALYLIGEGTVRISRMIAEGEERTLVILGPEDVFGEMAILDGAPRAATARVVEPARLCVLRKSDFEKLCEKQPGLALALMRNIIGGFSRKVRENSQDYWEMLHWTSGGREARS